MSSRVFNFAPGPATLPLSVLEEAQRDLVCLPGVGMSVLEISHRSQPFAAIVEEAEENLRRLMGVPDHYRVLFLQGGSRLQFSMVPMNFLRSKDASADYILTGTWGEKAMAEAPREGSARVAWSGREEGFCRVPSQDELDLDPRAAYVHMTSNETIHGVQFSQPPEVGSVPLICDASSDFLSRPIAVERFALIYACAQKNAGAAGLTLVIVNEELLERGGEDLHSMLDYRQIAKSGSLLNTPPVFAIYLFLLVTRWLERERGGLEALAEANRRKAETLYGAVDESHGFYDGHARRDSRSLMNVTFRLANQELEREFVSQAREQGLCELKGHRSVGGIRASIYNAMPQEGVVALSEFMTEFYHERS